jgi:ribosomal protein L34E
MLIRCNRGCTLKNGTTTGSVDVDEDKVICDYCGDAIDGISSFAKQSMIRAGNVVKNDKRKAFQFDCVTCKETVETEIIAGELRGCDCDGQCKFNVSSFTLAAMKSLGHED